MKVLLSWLREFAPFDGDPDLIGDTLSDLGTPVEEVTRLGEGLDGIVVARVLALRSHPNADKIQLVDVDAGDGEALQICCGAFNMAVGDLVPLATLGTVMPDGMKIERRKLRGEWSNGMLCSDRELGSGNGSRRHRDPAGRPRTGHAAGRRLGHRARRAVRARGQSRTGPTRCRSPGSLATSPPAFGLAVHPPDATRLHGRGAGQRDHDGRDRSPLTGAAGSRHGCSATSRWHRRRSGCSSG